MVYRDALMRYINHNVMVTTYGQKVVWGKLASVGDNHLILVNTIIRDEYESGGWFEQIQFATEDEANDGFASRHAETLIPMGSVIAITTPDTVSPGITELDRSGTNEEPMNEEPMNGDATRTSPQQSSQTGSDKPTDSPSESKQPQPATDAVPEPIRPIVVELGVHLLGLVEQKSDSQLGKSLTTCRKRIAKNYGTVIPCLNIRDNLDLNPKQYRILIQGHVAASGNLEMGRSLAINSSSNDSALDSIDGIKTKDPAFGSDSKWIDPSEVDEAQSRGMTVVEPHTVLTTHFSETLSKRLHEVITYQHVRELIARHYDSTPEMVDELLPTSLLLRYLRLFQGLLRERISIAAMMPIVQSAAFHLNLNAGDGAVIAEDELLRRVRIDIGREICSGFLTDSGRLAVVKLDPAREKMIQDAIEEGEDLDELPALASIPWSIDPSFERAVLLVRSSIARPHIAAALARRGESITVVAREEIPADVGLSIQAESLTQ